MRSLQSWISSQTTTIFKAFSPFHFYTTIAKKSLNPTKHNNKKALKVLDLVNLNYPKPKIPNNHLRLIQSCLQDLHHHPSQLKSDHTSFDQNLFDEMPDRNICMGTLFFQMHNKEVKTEATTLSCALSSLQSLKQGIQLHCLAIKAGFDEYVYIGSSLISLYEKCGKLDDAYIVFEEMPVRNVVSWTAIIVGFAQHWEVEMCLELYNRMRCSTSKPNDFTFTSILSVCTGSGTLGQGKSAHCQVIRLGFESYLHVRNALISMYSKCGNVEEADYIFGRMKKKDLVSWNSMIAGYSQHGLTEKAISMFTEMKKLDIRPDGITFLGVLSSCRHAGLVEHGHIVFNSMIKHGVEPDLDHYSCIIDLLGRAGLVKRAKSFIDKMPINPNAVIWGSLLSSCRQHGDVQIGIEAAENRLMLVPDCVATHVQLVNLYANAGCWEQAAKVRKMMKDRGLRTNPGYSWIEVKNEVYRFRAEDISNDRFHEILALVDGLVDNMRYYGYLPEIEKEFDLYSTFQL